jgi:hypothetical protein
MIAPGRVPAPVARPSSRIWRAMRALGRAIAALARVVIAPLIPLPLRSRRPRSGTSAPPDAAAPRVVPPCGPAAVRTSQFPGQLTLAEVEIVEVEPDFSERLYATVFELLQLGPRSKLLDLRAARVIPPALFECLATAWRVPPDIVPRLGILLDYERWTVLRNVAARRLQPLIDHGVAVEMFYVQQVDTLPGWFAGGDVRHDHLRDVINWLGTQWRPGPIWPTVLSRTASLVQTYAPVDAVPDMLLDLAAIARSFGCTEGSEQSAKHARTVLLWVGAQPSRTRCRALRTLAAAMLAQGQPRAALALLDSATKAAAALQDPIEEASALAEIGFHELQRGHHACSEGRFRAALALLSDDGPTYLRATLHHALALALLEQRKDAQQAEHHANTALGLRWDRRSQLASEDIALIARIRAQRAVASN